MTAYGLRLLHDPVGATEAQLEAAAPDAPVASAPMRGPVGSMA